MRSFTRNRQFRIFYFDDESRLLNSTKILIEKQLKSLADISLTQLESLESLTKNPCDLLIIIATHVNEDQFKNWMYNLKEDIKEQGGVWIPAIIISEISFDTMSTILFDIANTNWYFDVVSSKHLDSLPIRVANLLRIHDHLHELLRYDKELNKMQEKLVRIEKDISKH